MPQWLQYQSPDRSSPNGDNSPTPTPTPMTEPPSQQERGVVLSGVFASTVFMLGCIASAHGHDLRELVKDALCLACSPLQLKIFSLQQADGSFPKEEDADAATREEIRYTVKVADMFPASYTDGCVQFRVKMAPEKPALPPAAAPAVSTEPVPLRTPSPRVVGPVGKRVWSSSIDADEDFKVKRLYEASGSAADIVDCLKGVLEDVQWAIDGLIRTDTRPLQHRGRETSRPHELKSELNHLVQQVAAHPMAWPFHKPVDTMRVKDYLVFVKEPVDLSLVYKRVRAGVYASMAELKADLVKMCANSTTYNRPGDKFHTAGVELLKFIQQLA